MNRRPTFRIALLAAPVTAALLGAAMPFGHEARADDLVASSDSLAGNYLAARIAATDKDTDQAVEFFRKALAQDPDNAGLKLKAFLNFIANGNFEEGVTIGRDLDRGGNRTEIIALILATDELRKKNWSGAERALERNWQSPLDRLMAGLLHGWTQIAQKKTDKALAIADGLTGPAWYDLFVQYHSGLMALVGGNTEQAIDRLTKAVANRVGAQSANSTYMRATLALAHAHRRNNDNPAARQIISAALERLPQNPVFERALAAIDSGEPSGFEVRSPLRGAAEVFMNLGTAINREGGEQFARIYLQLASFLAGRDDVITLTLGELFDGQNKLVRANDIFSRIGPTSPYYPIARLETALNLDELEATEESRAIFTKLIAANPNDIVSHLSYGAVLARHEKFGEAIEVYKDLLETIDDPQRIHWTIFYRLGIAYERTKQWPLAEEAFRKALELYPDQPSVLNYLGYSWVDMNINLQEGLDMIRKAVELRPNDGYMVDSLGWAYYRLNRFEEAVVELERAVELRPGDPTINDHLGDAYWRAKRKLEATFQWRHALALDPPKDDIARIEAKLESGLDEVLKREAAEAKDKSKADVDKKG